MIATTPQHPSSFRDPSGFIFRDPNDHALRRQVNKSYESDYRMLMDSGLYAQLVDAGQLIEHQEIPKAAKISDDAYCVIEPREVDFVSYPYEWPFSALKNAALLTLTIQETALQKGMQLKDASAFNVQFEGARPIFIDTLSFEKYIPGQPWHAYGQFCRHFLAPLALMSYRDISLNRLAALYLDGVPLELASKLLPWRSRLSSGLLFHLHLHARMTDAYSGNAYSDQPKKQKAVSENGLKAVIAHLKKTVSRMSIKRRRSTWIDYYSDNSYSDEAFAQKKAVVLRYVEKVKPQTVWDLGANTGEFSRIAAQFDARTLAFDIDPQCNEENYQLCQQEDEQRLLPLFLDLANPTPSIGWAHRERHSLAERGPADLILALALVHHLAISNNLPFGHIAEYFSRLTDNLIMEFVPKEDPQVKRLLRVRKDIFQDYTEQAFESAFAEYFHIKERQAVGTDGRAVYLMARKNTAVSAKGIARYEIA